VDFNELRSKEWYWFQPTVTAQGQLLQFVKRQNEKFYFETLEKGSRIFHESASRAFRPATESEIQEYGPKSRKQKGYDAAKKKGWLLDGNPDFRGIRFNVEDPEAVSALEEFSTTPGTMLEVYTSMDSLPHVLSELRQCSSMTEEEILPFVRLLKENTESGVAWDVYVPNSSALGEFEKRLKVYFGSSRTSYHYVKIGSREVFKAFFRKGIRPIERSVIND
jgi:hypothetical protein